MTDEGVQEALRRLRDQIEAEGGPLTETIRPASESMGIAPFGPFVARGPRAARSPGEYAMLVESILEGYLLHYGAGRIVDARDPDVRLLAGDYLYAFGLARLARLGDLEAVDELAGLISLCARAHASVLEGDGGHDPHRLTRGLWALAALAIAAGDWPEATKAKTRAREESLGASEHVLDVANRRAEQLGLERHLGAALIGFERVGRRG